MKVAWYVSLIAVFLIAINPISAQEASRMNPQQYNAFLNELDAKLPLLKSHFAMLCLEPSWRHESQDVRNISNNALEVSGKLSSDMLKYLSTAVVSERTHPRLSTEYKMEFVLRQLMERAIGADSIRPIYDSRSDDTDYIAKTTAPLSQMLYEHVYASISDDPKCVGTN